MLVGIFNVHEKTSIHYSSYGSRYSVIEANFEMFHGKQNLGINDF